MSEGAADLCVACIWVFKKHMSLCRARVLFVICPCHGVGIEEASQQRNFRGTTVGPLINCAAPLILANGRFRFLMLAQIAAKLIDNSIGVVIMR